MCTKIKDVLMKNWLLFSSFLLVLISCSSKEVKQVESERLLASYQPLCSIEKHPEQPVYRLKMYGKTYNRFWYTAQEVETLYNSFVMQGRCL